MSNSNDFGGRPGLVVTADTTLIGEGITHLESTRQFLDVVIDTSAATAQTFTIDAGHTSSGGGRIGGLGMLARAGVD